LVPTYSKKQQNFQKAFVLYIRKQYIPSKVLFPIYQTGRCCKSYDHSIDISNVLQQIEICASVKLACVSRGYFVEEHCPFLGFKDQVPRPNSTSKIGAPCYCTTSLCTGHYLLRTVRYSPSMNMS
jgi:hypothetical protein